MMTIASCNSFGSPVSVIRFYQSRKTHLCAKLQINDYNAHLNHRNDQYQPDKGKEPEHVVESTFVKPQTLENIHKLNENDQERD